MVNRSALLQVYEDFAQALLHPYDIGEVLYSLSDQVVEVLQVDGAGVLLARNGDELEFVTATDRRVAVVEDRRDADAAGPGHDAYRDNRQVLVEDLAGDCPWPQYCEVATGQGFRAVAALPMPVGDRRIGAMALYRDAPGPWLDEDVRVGQVVANMASGYILNNLQLSESRTLAQQLQNALDSRIVIEQAKGVVAGRLGISPNEAFARLRSHARNQSMKLHDVCRSVVDGTLDL